MAISNNVLKRGIKEIIRSRQVLQRPLFCSSFFILYVTRLFFPVVTEIQIPYMQSLKMDLSLIIQYTVSTVYLVTLPDSVTVFGTNINLHVNEVVFSSDI